ncbi:MAG TPA: hypothetical protein VLQ48_03215 [Chloroflexia bacterium]|nr:hypothetical protein [Chloroflexia bacterium]
MSDKQKPPGIRVIRASELGEYNYCSRAWWYKHVAKLAPGGEVSARLEAGCEAHRSHGRTVVLSARLRLMGAALLIIGLLALALAIMSLRS